MLSGLALLLLVCLNMRVQGKPRSQVGAASPPLQGPGFNPGFGTPAAPGLDGRDSTGAAGVENVNCNCEFRRVQWICVSRVWLVPVSISRSDCRCNLLILWSSLRVEILTLWPFLSHSQGGFIFLQHVDGPLARLNLLSSTRARPGTAIRMCLH